MITLDTSSKKLCVVLGEAESAEPCSVVVSYIDRVLKYSGQQGSLNSYVPYTIESEFDVEQTTSTNGTTVVDIVPSPNASNDVWKYTHNVQTITIFNHDVIAHTVKVSIFDSTHHYIIQFTIDPSTTIFYDNNGWYIKNSAGIEPASGTGTFVPYTGATADVNLGEFQLLAGQITLDTSPSGTAVVGTTVWNNTIGSSETTLKGGNVILKNGVDLVARVVNKTYPSITLTKASYQAVKVSGATGQRLSVDLAQANIDLNSADTIGIVTETIAANQEGFIMTVGQLSEINTTGSLQGETWSDGDVLYLSPTTAGALTNIKPNGLTGHIVVMGYVEYKHAVHGSIYVKIMNGWELDELHNVYINSGTLADTDALIYESSSSLWKAKNILTVIGSASASTNGYLSSTDWTTFNGKQNALTNPVTGTGTNNEIAAFNITGSTITSLTTATYPSLTELSYVKGITSAIQTQINGRVNDAGDTMSGALQFSGTGHAGVVLNNLTTAQRTALSATAGMTVLDTSLSVMCYYTGSFWAYELYKIATNTTTTVITAANITGLSFDVEANSTYEIDGYYSVVCTSTGGIKFTQTVPTGATIEVNYDGIAGTAATSIKIRSTASGTLTPNAINTANLSSGVMVRGMIITAATAGTLVFQYASGVATQTSTITPRSFIKIRKIA
ncbi:MAG: hypothetical protein FGM16_06875 [Flavobacterium sp.]|nr:hypothetical protein [Flavobacterium sp.]